MTLLYTLLLGAGFTLIYAGVHSLPWLATIQSFFSGQVPTSAATGQPANPPGNSPSQTNPPNIGVGGKFL